MEHCLMGWSSSVRHQAEKRNKVCFTFEISMSMILTKTLHQEIQTKL